MPETIKLLVRLSTVIASCCRGSGTAVSSVPEILICSSIMPPLPASTRSTDSRGFSTSRSFPSSSRKRSFNRAAMAVASAFSSLKIRTFFEPTEDSSRSRIMSTRRPIESLGALMMIVLVRMSGVRLMDSRRAVLTSISLPSSSPSACRTYRSTVARSLRRRPPRLRPESTSSMSRTVSIALALASGTC